jgi:GNAT superfamily N-acetyltransferase
MRPDDLEAAITAIRDGGWGDRRASLQFFVYHPRAVPLVAEADRAIVGTAVATQSGTVGWVGLVFVAPDWRGHGLGGELTRAALRRLDALGCVSSVLAATNLGRPIYDRLGFATDGEYVVFKGPAREAAPADPRIQRLALTDLDSVCALDRRATAEDRSHVIRAIAEGWVIRDAHGHRGYALRTPWGLGPALAEDPADGALLLEVLRGHAGVNTVLITVPAGNAEAVSHLRSVGFREQQRLPRMVRGAPVAWQPQRVWTIFSFAMG